MGEDGQEDEVEQHQEEAFAESVEEVDGGPEGAARLFKVLVVMQVVSGQDALCAIVAEFVSRSHLIERRFNLKLIARRAGTAYKGLARCDSRPNRNDPNTPIAHF